MAFVWWHSNGTRILLAINLLLFPQSGSTETVDEPFSTPKSSSSDIRAFHKSLSLIEGAQLPKDLKGSPAIDGTIIEKLPNNKYHEAQWTARIDKIFDRKEQFPSTKIVLTSSLMKFDGIKLKVGNRYRVLPFVFPPFKDRVEWQYYITKMNVIGLSKKMQT